MIDTMLCDFSWNEDFGRWSILKKSVDDLSKDGTESNLDPVNAEEMVCRSKFLAVPSAIAAFPSAWVPFDAAVAIYLNTRAMTKAKIAYVFVRFTAEENTFLVIAAVTDHWFNNELIMEVTIAEVWCGMLEATLLFTMALPFLCGAVKLITGWWWSHSDVVFVVKKKERKEERERRGGKWQAGCTSAVFLNFKKDDSLPCYGVQH
jgi:hypothetical protein